MIAMMMAVANAQPVARQSISIVRNISSFGFSVALSPEGTDVFIGNVDSDSTMPDGPEYTVLFEHIAVDVTQNSHTVELEHNAVSDDDDRTEFLSTQFAYSLTVSNETEGGYILGMSRVSHDEGDEFLLLTHNVTSGNSQYVLPLSTYANQPYAGAQPDRVAISGDGTKTAVSFPDPNVNNSFNIIRFPDGTTYNPLYGVSPQGVAISNDGNSVSWCMFHQQAGDDSLPAYEFQVKKTPYDNGYITEYDLISTTLPANGAGQCRTALNHDGTVLAYSMRDVNQTRIYVYCYTSGVWTEVYNETIHETSGGGRCGIEIALSGASSRVVNEETSVTEVDFDLAIIVPSIGPETEVGRVFWFRRRDGVLATLMNPNITGRPSDVSMSYDGNTIAVGIIDGNSAYLYRSDCHSDAELGFDDVPVRRDLDSIRRPRRNDPTYTSRVEIWTTTPDFTASSSSSSSGLGLGAIVGIAVGSAVVVAAASFLIYRKMRGRGNVSGQSAGGGGSQSAPLLGDTT